MHEESPNPFWIRAFAILENEIYKKKALLRELNDIKSAIEQI